MAEGNCNTQPPPPAAAAAAAAMGRNRKKTVRVPETLWRLFGNRARTLAETLCSLLPPLPPPSPMKCGCRDGQICLACVGNEDAMSSLLRPDDPSDYRTLLNRCFVVVSENAPPLTGFSFVNRLSQPEIVKKTIEIIMVGSQRSCNVICNGYNKHTQSSHVVDLLITSAWCHLLRRIGDDAMVHLLKFASIFLPLPRRNHHQVAGPSISDLLPNFSRSRIGSTHQSSVPLPSQLRKKRKCVDVEDCSMNQSLCSQHFMSSDYILGFANLDDDLLREDFVGHHIYHQTSSKDKIGFQGTILRSCSAIDNNKINLNDEQQGLIKDSQKHLRPFSWQRRKQWKAVMKNEMMTSFVSPSDGMIMPMPSKSTATTLSSHVEKLPLVQNSKCFCISLLQASPIISRGMELNNKCMFYKANGFPSVFPKKHILNSVKPDNAGVLSLVKDVFGLTNKILSASTNLQPQKCGFCLLGSSCLCHSLLKLFKSLIRNSRRCHYMDLLDKHCQVSAISSSAARELIALEDCCLFAKKLRGRSTASQVECCLKDGTTSGCSLELNGPYCSKHQVVSFVWAVCRSVIPVDLLGTPSNWRALRRNISKLIRLRKFEKFSVSQCIHGLETSCIPLLSRIHMFDCLRHHELRKGLLKGCTMCSESEATLRNRLFSCWIYWLFSRLVLPIVQANFYVTESEVGKLETFYYRRNIWERITSRALSSLKKQSYHLLDDKLLRNILRKRSFGYSKVRFCPKEHGVRAVASLSAPSKIYAQNHLKDQSTASKSSLRIVQGMEMFSCFKSVNYVLRDLNSVLKGIKMKHTEMLGSFVSDYNDVYKNLLPFFVNLKNRFATFPSVYMVVCDVSKAFDSVDQDQLLSVMKEIMVDDIYHVKQLLQVVCTKKSLWTRRNETSLDKNISSSSIGSKASFPFHSLHGILVNQEGSKMIRKEDLYHNLYEHVKNNVLRVGQNLYLQEVGIPQGSVISSLLCSFYYGHLERKVIFPFLEKVDNNHPSEPSKGSFSGNICNADAIKNGSKDDCSKLHFHSLLRFVDDYLFMSTSKKHASSFFLRLQRGFRGYNFSINKAKSCVNFDMDNVPAISLKKMYTGEDGVSFVPWSGLLINTCTLEIQADYTRYLGIHISSTLTVHWHQKPGQHLKAKLCDYLRPKCHPIFYDSNINSVAVVRLNIYQSFMLCAMKFHCYACDMSSSCKFGAEYYFKMILYSLRYMHKLIKRRMHSLNTEQDIHPLLELKKKEVEWLGLKAYIRILKIKQSRHSELMSMLKSELFNHGMVTSSSLKYAVDDSHSSTFWKIKY